MKTKSILFVFLIWVSLFGFLVYDVYLGLNELSKIHRFDEIINRNQ